MRYSDKTRGEFYKTFDEAYAEGQDTYKKENLRGYVVILRLEERNMKYEHVQIRYPDDSDSDE
jgi:hypothetical protein